MEAEATEVVVAGTWQLRGGGARCLKCPINYLKAHLREPLRIYFVGGSHNDRLVRIRPRVVALVPMLVLLERALRQLVLAIALPLLGLERWGGERDGWHVRSLARLLRAESEGAGRCTSGRSGRDGPWWMGGRGYAVGHLLALCKLALLRLLLARGLLGLRLAARFLRIDFVAEEHLELCAPLERNLDRALRRGKEEGGVVRSQRREARRGASWAGGGGCGDKRIQELVGAHKRIARARVW